MIRGPHDDGFSLTELMVIVALMGFILAVAYSAMGVMRKSGTVTSTQSLLAREVSSPAHEVDKIVSQNKQIYNSGALLSNDYVLSVRAPKAPTVTTYQLRVFECTTDGRFTEKIYDQATLTSVPVYRRTITWSKNNVNRARAIPAFTYLASGVATPAASATSMKVVLWAKSDGKYVSATRQIFFRNR